jgi:hypothetical protein
MMMFVFAIFALVGFFVVSRQLGLVLVSILRRLLGVIPTIGSIILFFVRRILFVIFALISLVRRTIWGVLYVFRKTVSMIALLLAVSFQSFARVIREPHFVREKTANEIPVIPKPRPIVSTAGAIAGCWLAPTCVLVAFLVLGGTLNREWNRLKSAWQTSKQIVVTKIPEKGILDDGVILSDESPQTQESELAQKRPKWVTEGDTTAGDVQRFVISSGLWNTATEAKRALQTKAAEIVRADFDRRHRSFLDPKGSRFLTEEKVAKTAVKEEFTEQTTQDFGKFKGRMTRILWQIEVSPVVRTELYTDWKTASIQNRTIAAGSLLALLTLLANATGLFARLRRASEFSTTKSLATTAGCVAVWVAASGLVATHLLT